jgi:hypothetical protein
VHQAMISVSVLDFSGKLELEDILETKAETVLRFVDGSGQFARDFESRHLRRLLHVYSPNEMIALHEKRIASLENCIPQSVWLLVLPISVIAVFTRGLTLTARYWLTLILISVTFAIVVALIADLDTPSSGLIHLTSVPYGVSEST